MTPIRMGRVCISTTAGSISTGENTIAAGRWNYVFNSKLFSNTTVAYNHYQMSMADAYRKDIIETDKNGDPITDRNESYVYNSDYRSGIHDWSFHTDFDYMPSLTIMSSSEYLICIIPSDPGGDDLACERSCRRADSTGHRLQRFLEQLLHGHEFSFYA